MARAAFVRHARLALRRLVIVIGACSGSSERRPCSFPCLRRRVDLPALWRMAAENGSEADLLLTAGVVALPREHPP